MLIFFILGGCLNYKTFSFSKNNPFNFEMVSYDIIRCNLEGQPERNAQTEMKSIRTDQCHLEELHGVVPGRMERRNWWYYPGGFSS